jgi:hypothetical protein
MKKLIIFILILLVWINCYALNIDEAQVYIGHFCYIKYNPYKYSDIDLNKKILGKIIGLINDNGSEFIVLGSNGLVYIPIDKIKDIQILGE